MARGRQELISGPSTDRWLLFGDPNWADYDFSFTVKKEAGAQGVGALLRAADSSNRYGFILGANANTMNLMELIHKGRRGDAFENYGPQVELALTRPLPKVKAPGGAMKIGQSNRVRIQVRGQTASCFIDDKGFVHRDIKPANLLIASAGGKETALLADFGLARVYHASPLSGLTLRGDVGGTMAYMAPEQITQFREAQPAADQYAAAAALYHLLTGKTIFDLPKHPAKRILMVLHDEPISILQRRPDLPRPLAQTIHRALAKDPAVRFPSARGFRQALVRTQEPVRA